MLARVLSPEIFGIYAFAQAVIATTKSLSTFGLGTAYVHHSPESDHVDALSVHFTLTSSFTLVWAIILAVVSVLLFDYEQCWVIWVLIATSFVSQLTTSAYTSLVRQVSLQRPAILKLITAVITTLVALFLAWNRGDIWSLLSIDIAAAVILVVGYYVIKPVWRPRLVWSWPIVRYFLKFGSQVFLAGFFNRVLDKLDDLWTGYFLGNTALGFYSRAYTFANYPRRVLVSPIYATTVGIYAEVKNDRKRLSQVFVLLNSLVVQSSFLFSGVLFLVSPEFVRLVLGEQWLPMLDAFRLMTAYTMLDPIRVTMGNMFAATGQPEVIVRTRIIQLVTLAVGLVILGPYYGIEGVAVAATGTTTIGAGILIWRARKKVDFSLVHLIGVPIISLVIGILAAYSSISILDGVESYWLVGIVKIAVFIPVYAMIVVLVERRQIYEMFQLLKRMFLQRKSA